MQTDVLTPMYNMFVAFVLCQELNTYIGFQLGKSRTWLFEEGKYIVNLACITNLKFRENNGPKYLANVHEENTIAKDRMRVFFEIFCLMKCIEVFWPFPI